jgi:hypothetical protein
MKKTDNLIKAAIATGIIFISIMLFTIYKIYKKNKQLLKTKNLAAQQALEN